MKPDLASLYSQLNLRPGCSLEEFQRAYRRRIAELHPDRQPGRPHCAESDGTLPHLIALYTTVARFHRRYGRMPGVRSAGQSGFIVGQSHPFHASRLRNERPGTQQFDGSDDRHSPATLTLVILFLALLLLVASWSWLTSRSSDATGHRHAPTAAHTSSA